MTQSWSAEMTAEQFREDLTAYQRRMFRRIAKHPAGLLPRHRAKAGGVVVGDATLCVLILNGLIVLAGKRFVLTETGNTIAGWPMVPRP